MVLQVSVKDVIRLCMLLVGFTGVLSEVMKEIVRKKDIPFGREMKIGNKTITCGDKNWGVFHTLTYTCDDIKVQGLRLGYGYYPGWGVDENCQETRGQYELAELCKLMLSNTGKRYSRFIGAMVNNATCDRTAERRYLFRKTMEGYDWWLMYPGNGWLSSLSCLVKP